MNQIWKDVRDFEGLYQVSNFGRVKRLVGFGCRKERILKQYQNIEGYFFVSLSKNCKYKTCYIHRLVFEAFYRRLLPNEQCHHINQVCDCNLSTNLVAKDEFLHISEHHLGKHHSQQTRKKISQATKGKKHKRYKK